MVVAWSKFSCYFPPRWRAPWRKSPEVKAWQSCINLQAEMLNWMPVLLNLNLALAAFTCLSTSDLWAEMTLPRQNLLHLLYTTLTNIEHCSAQ